MTNPTSLKLRMTRDEQWLLTEKYMGLRNPYFEEDRKRLAAGEPLAYVIGWQPFLGLKIHLDSRPLIPRPETEYWTEQLLNVAGAEFGARAASAGAVSAPPGMDRSLAAAGRASVSAPPRRGGDAYPNSAPATFLDLCAGSGAIGCAVLKKLPYMEVFFGEIDSAHEATIRKNIRENGLDESRAHVRIGDLFAPFAGMQFDVIAANPPYVPASRSLPESVGSYEPHLALFSGTDGLHAMRRIAKALPAHLAPGGVAWVECDRGSAETARDLCTAQGLHAEIRTDQYGKPRVLVVHPVR